MDEEQAAQKEEGEATTTETGEQVLSRDSTLAYAGIMVSAAILLVALCGENSYNLSKHKHYKYGISVACIAMILSAVGWLLAYANKPGTGRVLLYNNYFLFLWNFLGASFLTFGGPFESTGNGYFAAWGLVIFATMALGINAAAMQAHVGNYVTMGPSAALLACAIIVMTAISFHGIHKHQSYFSELVYGLVVTIVTILIMGAMLKGGQSTQAAQLYVMILMMILWAVAAGLLTFRGPFLVTGNGYFGAWGGAFAAVYGVNAARTANQSESS